MTKAETRNRFKARRMALSEAEIEAGSLAIANRVLQLPVWSLEYFHVFLPIEALREVNTEPLLHILAGKDKRVVVSKSDFGSGNMRHFLLEDGTKLVRNKHGIPEPEKGIEIGVEKIDVVFVPLLAFDANGNRIGYGKGFYDKFLSQCRPGTIKIGLSLFEAAEPWEDVFESDVRLDYCVTPLRIWRF
jgi:5-formyltetrahydrofolate cyclo-ligase